jgi:hypothetical protein
MGKTAKFTVMKVPRQCTLVLVKVGCKGCKTFGSGEGRDEN